MPRLYKTIEIPKVDIVAFKSPQTGNLFRFEIYVPVGQIDAFTRRLKRAGVRDIDVDLVPEMSVAMILMTNRQRRNLAVIDRETFARVCCTGDVNALARVSVSAVLESAVNAKKERIGGHA